MFPFKERDLFHHFLFRRRILFRRSFIDLMLTHIGGVCFREILKRHNFRLEYRLSLLTLTLVGVWVVKGSNPLVLFSFIWRDSGVYFFRILIFILTLKVVAVRCWIYLALFFSLRGSAIRFIRHVLKFSKKRNAKRLLYFPTENSKYILIYSIWMGEGIVRVWEGLIRWSNPA